MIIGYTCWGSVRGCCGVLHGSKETADDHALFDQRQASAHNQANRPDQAYSDRTYYRVNEEGCLIKTDGQALMDAGHPVSYESLVLYRG